MANGGHRSAALAAKAAKRKAVVAEKKRLERQAASLEGRVAVAASCPIERCLQSRDLFSVGIGYIVVANRLPTGLLGCAFFLVDVYCLGVKGVTYRENTPSDFEETVELLSRLEHLSDIEPSCARKILTGAVAYAATCGIDPAKDFAKIKPILSAADDGLCSDTFTFGRDGKPVYVQGPTDSPQHIRQVVMTLNQRLGPDGWGSMVDVDQVFGADSDDPPDDPPPRIANDPA